MAIPSWLAALTGAGQFANNPANGFQPTFGDALQGIGHSMAEHYRQGQNATSTPTPMPAPGAPGGTPVGVMPPNWLAQYQDPTKLLSVAPPLPIASLPRIL